MAVTMKLLSSLVFLFGAVSFVFGVLAEHRKPAAGTPIPGKDVTICSYPKDPTVPLGGLSAVFLIASTGVGYLALFYPYMGKSVPLKRLLNTTILVVFFNIALAVAGLGLTFLLWATIQEHLHLSKNVHHNLETTCPTAKTGLFGGAAFLSLDASLLWLVTLMLAGNVREDYFEEINEDVRGEECKYPA